MATWMSADATALSGFVNWPARSAAAAGSATRIPCQCALDTVWAVLGTDKKKNTTKIYSNNLNNNNNNIIIIKLYDNGKVEKNAEFVCIDIILSS